LRKTAGMIWVRVCQHDGRRRNGSQSAKPIRATVNHDSSIVVLDEQRTVALMPTGANLDFAPRAKKREFKSLFSWRHFYHWRNYVS